RGSKSSYFLISHGNRSSISSIWVLRGTAFTVFWDLRSGRINLCRYGFMVEYFFKEDMENSDQYNRMLGASLCCIILILSFFDIKTRKLRRRETREGTGGWSDGKQHDDRARSYKGVVINGNMGPQNKERDSREYYVKGKGKMHEEPDSKWVKVAERGSKRPPNHYGNYRRDSESSRYKNVRREDGMRAYEAHTKLSSGQAQEDQSQRSLPQETREEGEIKSNETEDVRLASAGFQLELAKTQAEATEGIMEATDEEKGSLEVQGMVEKQDELTDDVVKDIDMEMDAITATLLKSGMDMEAEDEFKTLSEEEAEQASGAQIVHTQAQEEEELGNGFGDKAKHSTAGSNKTRMASALLSPCKRAAAKGGSRQGDSSKQLENKGPSHPKPANLKF
ncbi:hypothetical protein IGI04_035784, partial [Brassica rapa subsp. trilocularis]